MNRYERRAAWLALITLAVMLVLMVIVIQPAGATQPTTPTELPYTGLNLGLVFGVAVLTFGIGTLILGRYDGE